MRKKLSKKSFDKIKAHYLDQKKYLERSLSQEDYEIDSDGDEIDAIQAKTLLETKAKLTARNLNLLNRINFVLDKMDTVNINICKECEETIGEKRLLANPGCVICFDCACDQEDILKTHR